MPRSLRACSRSSQPNHLRNNPLPGVTLLTAGFVAAPVVVVPDVLAQIGFNVHEPLRGNHLVFASRVTEITPPIRTVNALCVNSNIEVFRAGDATVMRQLGFCKTTQTARLRSSVTHRGPRTFAGRLGSCRIWIRVRCLPSRSTLLSRHENLEHVPMLHRGHRQPVASSDHSLRCPPP
jgi:hypothetical protein